MAKPGARLSAMAGVFAVTGILMAIGGALAASQATVAIATLTMATAVLLNFVANRNLEPRTGSSPNRARVNEKGPVDCSASL